ERARLADMEEQHSRELMHTNSLVLGLSRAAAHIQTDAGIEQVMQSVGHELRRLRMHCAILLAEPGEQTLVCHYVSLSERVLQTIERASGLRPLALRISASALPAIYELFNHSLPIFIADVERQAKLYLPKLNMTLLKHLLTSIELLSRTPLCLLPMAS